MSKPTHWQPGQTAGQLIKSGKFKEAVPLVAKEIKLALRNAVITEGEMESLFVAFSSILLDPSDYENVQVIGDKFLAIELRIPNYLRPVSKEEFYNNIKLNYETIEPSNT